MYTKALRLITENHKIPQVDKRKITKKYTVVACITNCKALNEKMPLWFQFRNANKPGELSKPQQDALNQHRTTCRVNTSAAGSTTGDSWVKVLTQLAYVLEKHKDLYGAGKKILVTYDQHKCHGHKAAAFCSKKGWILRLVPSRMTGVLQPVDGAVCRRLKIRMRHRCGEIEEEHGTGWMSMVKLGVTSWQDLLATRGDELVNEFELCGFGFQKNVFDLKPELRQIYDHTKFQEIVDKWQSKTRDPRLFFCNGCKKWISDICLAGGDLLSSDICKFACSGDGNHVY